jgi:hypothetical protein
VHGLDIRESIMTVGSLAARIVRYDPGFDKYVGGEQ